MALEENKNFKLPLSVVTHTDVARLNRELEAVIDFLDQAALRKSGTKVTAPRTSVLLDELAKVNSINLLHAPERQQMHAFLLQVKKDAPVVHISFAAVASPAFLQTVIAWFRTNAHPLLLLEVGLQPSMAAGCMVRTTSKSFDFSLRQRLLKNKLQLIALLGVQK